MAENNTFAGTIDALMKGMDGFVSSKTVVGDPIKIGDTILFPLVDISFGMGSGSFAGEKKRNTGGGVGAKISPSAVLVIQNGATRVISVKNQDGIMKILDMIPEFVDRFVQGREAKKNPERAEAYRQAKDEAAEMMQDILENGVADAEPTEI
jgi:uncharacterized spore protein YtfJ